MIHSPFSIFAPFADKLRIVLTVKKDETSTDEDFAKFIGSNAIASLQQVHGNRAIVVDQPTSRTEQADALATDVKNLWLTIRAADCQQFIIYAPDQNVIALIHAGWKGLVAGMIPSTFDLLKERWKIDPSTVFVGMGPSLCLQCSDFTDPKTELPTIDPRFFHDRHVDLRGVADDQLQTAGVSPDHTERMPDCTRCKSNMYWSARGGNKEKIDQGYRNILAAVLIDN